MRRDRVRALVTFITLLISARRRRTESYIALPVCLSLTATAANISIHWPLWIQGGAFTQIVGLTLIYDVPPSCPSAHPVLPISHQPKQNQAEGGTAYIKSSTTQLAIQVDASLCSVRWNFGHKRNPACFGHFWQISFCQKWAKKFSWLSAEIEKKNPASVEHYLRIIFPFINHWLKVMSDDPVCL